MRQFLILSLSVLVVVGCTSPIARTSLNPANTKPNPSIGIFSKSVLGDALGNELVRYGFTVIERGRLESVLDELKLSLSGVIKEGDMKRVGEILSIDVLLFVTATAEQQFPSKIGSATVKLVDAEKGVLIGGVTYQNGRGGTPGSPADSGIKESLPETAERIGREIAIAFGKTKPTF